MDGDIQESKFSDKNDKNDKRIYDQLPFEFNPTFTITTAPIPGENLVLLKDFRDGEYFLKTAINPWIVPKYLEKKLSVYFLEVIACCPHDSKFGHKILKNYLHSKGKKGFILENISEIELLEEFYKHFYTSSNLISKSIKMRESSSIEDDSANKKDISNKKEIIFDIKVSSSNKESKLISALVDRKIIAFEEEIIFHLSTDYDENIKEPFLPDPDITKPVSNTYNYHLIGNREVGKYKIKNTRYTTSSRYWNTDNNYNPEIFGFCPMDPLLMGFIKRKIAKVELEEWFEVNDNGFLAIMYEFQLRRNKIIEPKSKLILSFEREACLTTYPYLEELLGEEYKILYLDNITYLFKIKQDNIILYGELFIPNSKRKVDGKSFLDLDHMMNLKEAYLKRTKLTMLLQKFSIKIFSPDEFYSTLPERAISLKRRMEKFYELRNKGNAHLGDCQLVHYSDKGQIYAKSTIREPGYICSNGLILLAKENWLYHYNIISGKNKSYDYQWVDGRPRDEEPYHFDLYCLIADGIKNNRNIRNSFETILGELPKLSYNKGKKKEEIFSKTEIKYEWIRELLGKTES